MWEGFVPFLVPIMFKHFLGFLEIQEKNPQNCLNRDCKGKTPCVKFKNII